MVRDPSELPAFSPTEGPDPVHSQIERWLESLIRDGELTAGDRLPNERELAVRIGVSRMTLRQSLGALERSGLLHRVPGRNGGAFVAEGQVLVDLSILPGLAAQIRQSQSDPTSTVVVAERRPAPSEVAVALRLREGAPAHYIERIRRAGEREIALERSWFPVEIAADLLERDLTGSMYELLEGYGRKPVEASEYITPIVDAPSAAALGLEAARPLLHVRRTALDAAGAPVEYSEDVFRPDRVQFMVTRRIG